MAASVRIKFSQFFDRKKVIDALSKKEARVLGGTGSFYKTVVKRSMRSGGKKNKVSEPGIPPRWHVKTLRKSIVFGYDARRSTVVVGALPSNGKNGNAAETLEYGGTTTILLRRKGKSGLKGRFKKIRVKVKPRPFVGPRSINYKIGEDKLKELTKKIPLR